MVNIFSGLEKFGLNLKEDVSLFEEKNEAKPTRTKKDDEIHEVKEVDFLLDRTYTCPVCDAELKAKTVKNAKAKLISTDIDLRTKHEGIDMVKYDVIVCPKCGYAALTRYFASIMSAQRKLVRENITPHFKGMSHDGEIYTYDEAVERYEITLANAVVKKAKASEKAFICLKMGWLMRGYAESLTADGKEEKSKLAQLDKAEREYLKNAMEGFVLAKQKEMFPMCGIDEHTMDYLIAALAVRVDKYDIASRTVSNILASSASPRRIKDKARELKDIIVKNREKSEH